MSLIKVHYVFSSNVLRVFLPKAWCCLYLGWSDNLTINYNALSILFVTWQPSNHNFRQVVLIFVVWIPHGYRQFLDVAWSKPSKKRGKKFFLAISLVLIDIEGTKLCHFVPKPVGLQSSEAANPVVHEFAARWCQYVLFPPLFYLFHCRITQKLVDEFLLAQLWLDSRSNCSHT